jgi:hypothetical protein
MLVRFELNLNFLDFFYKKKIKISNYLKICPVGAELFREDRHDEADSRFPQFCERPQNHSLHLQKSICSENYTEHVTTE